ncbi:hypothetical protein [Legionella cardiaca]|uniref:Uncharacterized protein n=1 Tax=Legionella cardiaca TaxID=1071983 RepID=A0ABY8AV28_9GAMM|nr:hypothetical protein [Legionella cardiaca]WED43599.1 hypothetical protein PXX05_02150 [Legionella cardiaca]
MHQFNRESRLTVYHMPGRNITVVQGNSGVVYPFYKSTGYNSQSDETWLPWMGYFAPHPLEECKNQLYMAKPGICSLSPEIIGILKKHLNQNTLNFIGRLGNDESLIISSCLGGGEWSRFPDLRKELMNLRTIKKYIKHIEIASIKNIELPLSASRELVLFKGINCTHLVLASQAIVADKMESLTTEESSKYVSDFYVQDKERFPSLNDLTDLRDARHASQIRFKYLQKLGHRHPASSNDKNSNEAISKSNRSV